MSTRLTRPAARPRRDEEKITLSRSSQRKLVKNRYKFLHTTFLTQDGPAEGTIWFDTAEPRKQPRCVEAVIHEVKRRGASFVWFEGGEHETLDHFMLMIEIGQYVLIGVTPLTMSHTEI